MDARDKRGHDEMGIGMQDTPRTPSRLFSVALALTALITPLAVHLFLPVIPVVKAELALSDAQAQFTFSIALFVMAFATLAYGSLSDRFGRRPVLLSGLALFLVGSAISAVAQTVGTLAFGRLVQAIGAGCGMTLLRVIARDAYRAEYLVRAIAYLTMFYTLGPMFAPIVGGALVDTLGWRSVFGFALVVGGAITVMAYAAIPETRPQRAAGASDEGILRAYDALLRRPVFTAFVLQTGLNTGAFMTLASASATLMKDVLQPAVDRVGLYFLLFPIGYFLGTVLSSRVGSRASNETMVLIGSLLAMHDNLRAGAVAAQRHRDADRDFRARLLPHDVARHRAALFHGRLHGGDPGACRDGSGDGRLHAELLGRDLCSDLWADRRRNAAAHGVHHVLLRRAVPIGGRCAVLARAPERDRSQAVRVLTRKAHA